MNKPKLHLAWTVDDGPTSYTNQMISVFKSTLKQQPIPATWYIQWDNLNRLNRLGLYQKLQNNHNHEIAIHGVSTIANHIHWFPTDNKKHANFTSIAEAITAIEKFKNYLTKNGLQTKFVRAPTGLHSEIMAYLRKLGVKNTEVNNLSRQIIRGNSQKKNSKYQVQFNTVQVDVASLNTHLRRLALHLWGGKKNGGVSAQSWEIETAGLRTGRKDTFTREYLKNSLYARVIKDRSLVILCHDTTQKDITAVERDIKMVHKFAEEKNIDIVYHTMSSLYKQVVGRNP